MKPTVRAVRCSMQASDEAVYEALARATEPLAGAWERLKAAQRIGIKFNQGWPEERLVFHKGRYQELTDLSVVRATLRLLRERTTAELICSEISVFKHDRDPEPGPTINLMPLLNEFDVRFCDGNLPPHSIYQVPGGGQMFRQYLLPTDAAGCDAFVSVQKMKNHKFMGVTLTLKNLFGLTPQAPFGRERHYFHHLVRMPYLLADLGRIFDPALCIVDAIVGQAGAEWGGEAREPQCLLAGDQVIATDACATHLMGHDPAGDWPTPPFHRARNALLVASEAGFGTVNLGEIDFQSEVEAPVASFGTIETDPLETIVSWRRTTCEQALYYRDHRSEFDRYAGEYILLQDGEVKWHDAKSHLVRSRRELAGENKQSAMWLKYVDPEEAEGEHYEVYERILKMLKEQGY